MRVTRKIFTRAAANLFFNQFSRDFLFSYLLFLLFLHSLSFFFLHVWFLILKMYILIHIWLYGEVSEKRIFHLAFFRKQDCFFLASLKFYYLNFQYSFFCCCIHFFLICNFTIFLLITFFVYILWIKIDEFSHWYCVALCSVLGQERVNKHKFFWIFNIKSTSEIKKLKT